MRDVFEFAKFFIKKGADSTPNTYDGNVKLQKLLVLADMAHRARCRQPLFNDEILAFKNGLVVEKVRLKYRNDYFTLKAESDRFDPDFSMEENETLMAVIGLYGGLTARELSSLSHVFRSWQTAYKNGTDQRGYHSKEQSVVDFNAFPEDIEAVGRAVNAYLETLKENPKFEVINGIRFYYDDDIVLTDDIIAELEKFSLICDEDSYSVCMDDGKLVIF